MLSAIAIIPSAPVLVPELAGAAADEVAELRVEEAQVLNYLKATRHERGLLVNFGGPSLEFKRFVFSAQRQSSDLNIENP